MISNPTKWKDKGIQGVIFDLGHTLIEYRNCHWPQINDRGFRQAYQTLRDHAFSLPMYFDFIDLYDNIKEKHRRRAAETMAGWKAADVVKDLLEEIGLPVTQDMIDEFLEAVYAPSREIMYTRPETGNFLNELKKAGFRLGIISNTIYPSSLHETDLKRFGFADYFDFGLYSSECEHRKPHQSIFEAGIKKVGAPPESIIYIGDRYDTDVLGAQAAGMRAILKFCPRQSYPDPLPSNLLVVQNLHDLLNGHKPFQPDAIA